MVSHNNREFPTRWGSFGTNIWGTRLLSPTEQICNMSVRLKLNVNRALVKGKRIILVSDSVVRGTNSRKIKEMILDAGIAEVHFRITSPPHSLALLLRDRHPQWEKLLTATITEGEMRQHLAIDSLKLIPLNGLYRAIGEAKGRDNNYPQYCNACFAGEYLVEPSDMITKGFALKAAE